MKRSPPDGSTIQRGRFSVPSFTFWPGDLGKRFKIHPAYIPRPAAYGGIWLRLAAVGSESAG
jgi:hypothetical protein